MPANDTYREWASSVILAALEAARVSRDQISFQDQLEQRIGDMSDSHALFQLLPEPPDAVHGAYLSLSFGRVDSTQTVLIWPCVVNQRSEIYQEATRHFYRELATLPELERRIDNPNPELYELSFA